MGQTDFSGISYQKMQTFITAAETPSFNSAAIQLNTSVSAVSKTISTLEHELGIQLFFRRATGAVLTPAGKVLLEKWKDIASDIVSSVEKALAVQASKTYSVTIGLADTLLHDEISPAVEKFKSLYHQVSLRFTRTDAGTLIKRFNDEKLDMILTCEKDLGNIEGKDARWGVIRDGIFCIYVPKDNPLNSRCEEEVSFYDLTSEKFIAIDDLMMPNYNKRLYEICQKFGFTPTIETFADSTGSVMAQMQFGESICFAPNYLNVERDSGIKKFIISELKDFKCPKLLIWHDHGEDNPYINILAECILNKI